MSRALRLTECRAQWQVSSVFGLDPFSGSTQPPDYITGGPLLGGSGQIWPAYQNFEETTKGTIEVGKLADFAVLSENPLTVDPKKLAKLKVLRASKEGAPIHQA